MTTLENMFSAMSSARPARAQDDDDYTLRSAFVVLRNYATSVLISIPKRRLIEYLPAGETYRPITGRQISIHSLCSLNIATTCVASMMGSLTGASSLPSTQMAIIAGPNGEFKVATAHPVTPLADGELIVKTVAVALNPVDTKLMGPFITQNAIFGYDLAGVVVAVGKASVREFKVGDRVCGSARGQNPNKPLGGAFAEYVSVPADITLKIPEHMSFEEAASLGTAIASACLSIFWTAKIPASIKEPATKPFPVLVYGASTASGTMLLQILKICGSHTIATCSPKNFDLVKTYGADEVFDYKSPTCAENIRVTTKNSMKFAFDCITTEATTKICYSAIGRAGGKYVALNPYSESAASRKVITPDWILATTIVGEGSAWPEPYRREPDPEIRKVATAMYSSVQELLDNKMLKPHPIEVSNGGLPAILEGVERLRKSEISGKKLVYQLI